MEKRRQNKLRILFFGLGSIGKKHANIIQDNFDFELYAYRTNKGQEKNDLNIQEFNDLEKVFSIKPDVVFITNPTALHVSTALECAKRNLPLFIEKPISHSPKNLDKLDGEIRKRNLFTYVAYNMRFHPVVTHLRDLVSKKEKPIYFRVICSSYLPKWRLGQEYFNSYSAKRELGGGVILDLSHEFDYITWLFGEIKNIEGYCNKISNLNIESEDILEAQIMCNSDIKGSLHLDYFSLNNERKIQIYYNDKYIEGNFLENTIKIKRQDSEEQIIKYQCSPEDIYKRQLVYFFEQYYKKNLDIMNNFPEALKTFKKILTFKKKYCSI